MNDTPAHNEIIDFWFSERVRPFHFKKSKDFDDEIRTKFHAVYQQAQAGALDAWQQAAMSSLALVILCDQFSRNMFREHKQAFWSDEKALAVAKHAIEKGFDKMLTQAERAFLYMPFMHSESLHDQEASMRLYQSLGGEDNLKFALAHYEIIARFGRFPHRNEILGRESTAEEIEFLRQPNSSF